MCVYFSLGFFCEAGFYLYYVVYASDVYMPEGFMLACFVAKKGEKNGIFIPSICLHLFCSFMYALPVLLLLHLFCNYFRFV